MKVNRVKILESNLYIKISLIEVLIKIELVRKLKGLLILVVI